MALFSFDSDTEMQNSDHAIANASEITKCSLRMGALDDHLLPSVEESSEKNPDLKSEEASSADDHLLPSVKKSSEKNPELKSKEASGAGTTRRKELHGTTCIRALSGTWGKKLEAEFQAYKFQFSCSNVSETFSDFVLLIESKLDFDVGDLELELFLVSKTVKTTISSCGALHLNEEEMRKAKCFQEFFFNGVYGKLFTGSKFKGTERKFIVPDRENKLWNQSYMYLLLPLESPTDSNDDSLGINWRGINSCCSVVEMMNTRALLDAQTRNGDKEIVSTTETEPFVIKSTGETFINFANSSSEISNLEETVVLAIHSGKIYSIVEVARDTSADSPFEVSSDGIASSEYASYSDYFTRKYDIVLKYPSQPLLRLKQSHNAHNLLVDFLDEVTSKVSKSGRLKKPQMHAHMPPELLVCINIPRSVEKSLYLLPSVMNRLESLMLATQLREEIAFNPSKTQISSLLILEALTSLRSCESFSMERLELLGDSVLKYVTSCNLFLKFPEEHEGQLTSRRTSIISNANLHKLGTYRKIQGYVRDGAFDPRRWVAPGQHSLRPVPCKCGLDSLEVPLNGNFQTEDLKIVVGKSCDKGHRWMGSKTIADCVEALIGAYYVGGGLVAAIHVMTWLGIDAELEPSLVKEAISVASLRSYVPILNEIEALESKLGVVFSTKGLLQEAITHAAPQESSLGYCYERFEFLGDSVLDLLVTKHLYESFTDIDPGELTDLRSASVSNENFAQIAVRHNLHPHLQCCSELLSKQITEYVNSFSESCNTSKACQVAKVPKALGDMVESIAGALLVDQNLNVEEVWEIFKPLLSPIVTPDKLELPPLRELIELSDSLGYFIKEKCTQKGELVHAEITVQLKDVLLIGNGYERGRKAARGEAARRLLEELETRGISFSKKRKHGPSDVDDPSSTEKSVGSHIKTVGEEASEEAPNNKKHKGTQTEPLEKLTKTITAQFSTDDAPVAISSINMKKGGPRTALFDLCKKQQWPMPTFVTEETKSRTPLEIGEGTERRTGFNSFVSSVVLCIPSSGEFECKGEARADKKSSLDSASLIMLYHLQREGKLVIRDSS